MLRITVSPSFLLMLVAGLGMAGVANAGWMAHADFSACPSQYASGTGDEGPFDSESACQARLGSITRLACASYSCIDQGGGSQSSGGLPSAGAAGMEGAMQMGFAIGQALRQQAEAAAQARAQEQARAAAEAQQRAAEQEREQDAASKRLLGEDGGAGSGELSLMGVSQAPQLSLMTGDQALQPMTTTNTQSDQKAANGTAPKSDAFNRGYSEASQCVSQNAGPYCAAMSGPAWQACLTDYRNGYQVGLTEQNRKLGEATQAGLQDGKNGKPDGSFNDPRATGGCRDEWVGSYGNGYYKGRHASDQVVGK